MNAELLLMFTLSCDRAYLYAHPERELTVDEQASYEGVLTERSRGVPAQYITDHQEFWGMDLIVSPSVLIPRPETEHVVEAVLELLTSDLGPQTSDFRGSFQFKGRQAMSGVRSLRSDVRVVDVGTGSGCIALALAKELPQAEIHATDISSAALEIARANAARHQLENRIHFHAADLLEGTSPETFDFIVSNPPYVGDAEEDQVQLEVRKFEPRNAVFAGPTGLEVIARLVPQARTALRSGGWLVMEISGSTAAGAKQMLAKWEEVRIINDLQGIPRVLATQKAAR